MISGARKYIQDDNNYIGKIGKITHICPICGNIYTTNIKLDVKCDIICDNTEGYTIITPEIKKMCDCGHETLQIDNSMQAIIKVLIDKKYVIKSCCEGHVYIKNGISVYDYPFITIEPILNNNLPHRDLKVISNLLTSTITCKKFDCLCPCDFNKYKSEILDLMLNFVSSLPFNTQSNTKMNLNCNCRCDCQ